MESRVSSSGAGGRGGREGAVRHIRNFEYYPKSDGTPLEGLEEVMGMVWWTLLKDLPACQGWEAGSCCNPGRRWWSGRSLVG